MQTELSKLLLCAFVYSFDFYVLLIVGRICVLPCSLYLHTGISKVVICTCCPPLKRTILNIIVLCLASLNLLAKFQKYWVRLKKACNKFMPGVLARILL